MKMSALIALVLTLNSCNTMVGMWLDTKQAYHWTKEKIQEPNTGGNDGTYDDSGAPVY